MEKARRAGRRDLIRLLLAAPLAAKMGFAEPQRQSAVLRLVNMLNRTSFGDLPPVPVEYAKMLIASTLASAASGSEIVSARIIRNLAEEQGGRPETNVWFDAAKLPANQAARVNAMMSDAAASDDSDIRNVAHTGTCVTAVGLAMGQRVGSSGKNLLSAMLSGYEAAGRIGEAVGPPHEALSGSWGHGFHASVIVAFGGTVAAARLLGLSDEQTAHAIGLTATTMGGLAIGTNSWAREYHAGNAALCAVNAALAASRGYTVNDEMLQGPGGFFAVFGDREPRLAALTRPLAGDWEIAKFLAIKLAPGAHALQPAAEAAVNAAREMRGSPEEVAKILLSGPQIHTITSRQPPKDAVEAIHSLPYFIASAVIDRDFSWVHTTPEKIHRPLVGQVMGLIEMDPAPRPVRYEWSWGATVTILTKSGQTYSSTVDAPRGSAPRGIAWSDVDAKFRALMPKSGMSAARIEELLATIHNFDKLDHVSELVERLT